MKRHVLKCWPEFFDAIADGRKTFELRRDDREYAVGDVLELRWWNPETESYALIESRSRGPYAEIFARSHRAGWESWGNEV